MNTQVCSNTYIFIKISFSNSKPDKAVAAAGTAEVILEDCEDKEDDINLPDADVEALLQKELLSMGMVKLLALLLLLLISSNTSVITFVFTYNMHYTKNLQKAKT